MAITYNSTPDGLLTYTSPSPKLCRQSDGVFRYQPNNIYLNSAAPANQSITVVQGATYEIIITGSVSITWSGAFTGTTTAGTHAFTAATGTLTGGSTSGSGTVSVRRTPSVNTYVATAGTAVYRLPYEWDASGNPLGIRVESARTNSILRSRDLANASWTKRGTATATRTVTGVDGVANSASTVSVGTLAANDILQIVGVGTFAANATLSASVFMQRISTSGTVQIINAQNDTRGNWNVNLALLGSGWNLITASHPAVTVVSSFQAQADGSAGLLFCTGGGTLSFNVDLCQLELGSNASSPIETFGSTVTRAEDVLSLVGSFPTNANAMTLYAEFAWNGVLTDVNAGIGVSGSNALDRIEVRTGYPYVSSAAGGSDGFTTPAGWVATRSLTRRAVAYAANDFAACINGGAVSTDSTLTVPTALDRFRIPIAGAGDFDAHVSEIAIFPRRLSNSELQALTAA